MVDPKPATTMAIERRDRLSYEEFATEFLYPHKPVVITGALTGWKALSQWTPEYFRERYGSLRLTGGGQHYTLGGFVPRKNGGQYFTMGEFIDMVDSSSADQPAPYLRNLQITGFLPELNADLLPLPEYFSPNWLDGPLTKPLHSRLNRGGCELYIGGAGGKFPLLHYDTWHIHTFLSQIYGVKEYTIFPPEHGQYLYAKGNQSTLPDFENVDLEKYPLYAHATAIRFQLHPGEILFVPAGWWHTTKMLSTSITISVSRVNASNWKRFSQDLVTGAPRPMKPLVSVYLAGLRLSRAIYNSR
jgi:histone arginine demethylase JMJD6